MNTTNHSIIITHSPDILKPEFLKTQNAIVIHSPLNIKLKKRTAEWIDLKINVQFDDKNLMSWMQPSAVFKCLGLDISDKETWIMNKTNQDTIMIHIENRSFYYDVDIKKGNIIALVYFNGNFSGIEYKIKN